jgi:hypothetical protein
MNHEANHDTPPRALIAMSTGILACAILVMAFGVGKLTGTVDPLIARRGVGAMLGLMLMVTGNFVPKLRLFQPATGATHSDAIDRFAGWIFVVCGFAFAAAFLFVPANQVFIVPPLIVLAGFLAVLIRWLRSKGTLPGRVTSGRRTLVMMLASILWVCAIFLADAIWGDYVSRWMAIAFPILLILFSAFRASKF